MKKFMAVCATALLLGQEPLVLYAAEAATVKSVRVSADSVFIDLDKQVQYKAIVQEQPPKLILDLMDSRLSTLQDIPASGGVLRKVRTGQFQAAPVAISRVVMDLTQKAAYEITRRGNELVVMFGARAAAAVKDAPAAPRIITPEPAAQPVEMTLEPAPVTPSDAGRPAAAPVIAPRKASASSSSSRSIMDTLPRDPISFDYSDADIREVIDMLAAKARINIIYADDVSGTVTITLEKVPFDEAFKTLLNVKGLAAQQVGANILRIASPNTLLSEQKKALPQTSVFFLNYAKASEIKAQLVAVAQAEGRSAAQFNSDDNNNALIVTDTQLGLDATARLIRSLDRAPKQVLIEVKLVEVNLVDEFDLGVKWGYATAFDSKGRYIGAADSVSGLPLPAPTGTGVALDAKNIYGTFRFGKMTSTTLLDATISAAARKGKAKVLSDPKVATLNNKEANINITSQRPYVTTDVTTTGGVSVATNKVTYVTTGIVLKVTPVITSDGRISMNVNPSVSQPSATAGVAAPSVDTREAKTNVIVDNGETVVIGGLIYDTQNDEVAKVPLLGDIPLLGVLFRRKTVSRNRLELLIFVTPKVMEN